VKSNLITRKYFLKLSKILFDCDVPPSVPDESVWGAYKRGFLTVRLLCHFKLVQAHFHGSRYLASKSFIAYAQAYSAYSFQSQSQLGVS